MDIWKIGVQISLANGVSPVLAVIAKDMLGLKGPIKDVENAFASWKTAALGAVGVITGAAMIGGLAKLASYGSDVNHQLELMKTAGMGNLEIQQGIAAALKTTAAVQTTNYAGNLQHIRELRYAFGETSIATQYLNEVSRANAILNAVKGGGNDQVWELVKSLEQKGLTTDPKAFMSYVNEMTKVVEATGGKVTPAAFMQAFKYGRTAMLGWDEEFITGYLPRLIQSMSGGGSSNGTGGPGNALMSGFAKVVQGQIEKKAAAEFNRLGLTTSYAPIKGSSMAQADIVGASLFTANPYKWTQEILVPALNAHGITDKMAVLQEISRLFQVRTASQVIGEMALQGVAREGANSPFEKDKHLQQIAMGNVQSYAELSNKDYQTIERQFSAQFKSLLQVLGGPAMQMAIPVMKGMTDALTTASQWAAAHPTGIKIVVEGIAAVGAALIALGGAAVAAAAISIAGPVAAGVAALGGFVAVIAALNWKEVKTVLDGLGNAILSGVQWLIKQITAAWNAVSSFFGSSGAVAPRGAPTGSDHNYHGGRTGQSMVGKQSMNFVPPPSAGSGSQSPGNVYMDGKKVGQIVSKHQSLAANGPLVGSAYFDPTRTYTPVDYSGG